jgi:hypothetical protein
MRLESDPGPASAGSSGVSLSIRVRNREEGALRRVVRFGVFVTELGVAGALVVLIIVLRTTAAPTPDRSPVYPFTGRLAGGSAITFATAIDCDRLVNPFLKKWCQLEINFDPALLPKGVPTQGDRAVVFAGMAWGLVRGNDAVCDRPAIRGWIEAVGHSAGGSELCRSSFAALRAQGSFGITDPQTGATLTVVLPQASPS